MSLTNSTIIRFEIDYFWLPINRKYQATIKVKLPVEIDEDGEPTRDIPYFLVDPGTVLIGEELTYRWGEFQRNDDDYGQCFRYRETLINTATIEELKSSTEYYVNQTVTTLRTVACVNKEAQSKVPERCVLVFEI